MNQQSIVLVQRSFEKLAPIADKVAVTFYARLFDTHPELRPFFAPDIRPQLAKMIMVLNVLINNLNTPGVLLPVVRNLADRHKGYGVSDADFLGFGLALNWTLRCTLHEDFTADVERAWNQAFDMLSIAMKQMMSEPRRRRFPDREAQH